MLDDDSFEITSEGKMKKTEPGDKTKLRSFGNLVAVVGSILAVTIFAGRRKPVNTEIKTKAFVENLDNYLATSEAKFDDIVPGTEKKIIWADSSKKKTEFAIVYLHGFSATRQETAPLSDKLAGDWGCNLFYTRLAGHGRTGSAMAEPTVNDWLNDADEALEIGRLIGEKVIIIGTSTGGTLATWLAARHAAIGGNEDDQYDDNDIAAVILISPNYWVKASGAGAMLWPWGKQILHMVQGASYEWEPMNEKHKQYWTNRYPSAALVEMMKLLDHVNKMPFEKVNVPALFIYSPNDKVVDTTEIEHAFARFGSSMKQLEVLEEVEDRNNHVLAGDILSPGTTNKVADLISRFISRL